VYSVIWPWRRKRLKRDAAQPFEAQPFEAQPFEAQPFEAQPLGAPPPAQPLSAPPLEQSVGTGSAWQVDHRPQPPVTWSGQQDAGRFDARTDVYSISAAHQASQVPPANGRLGSQMPGIFCPRCGAPNPDNARFCSQCATPLVRTDRVSAGETTSMIFTGMEPADGEPGDQAAADAAVVDTLPPNTALLVVRRGPNEGSRFLLDSELTEVGRRPDSDIFLDDVTVSRRHAEFYRQGGKFAVRDVGSLNGTYVNRQRIEEVALNAGDEVQIGKFRMVFLQGRLSHAESGV
jgi:hypothetical protein